MTTADRDREEAEEAIEETLRKANEAKDRDGRAQPEADEVKP